MLILVLLSELPESRLRHHTIVEGITERKSTFCMHFKSLRIASGSSLLAIITLIVIIVDETLGGMPLN